MNILKNQINNRKFLLSLVLTFSFLLMGIKFYAWYYTHSQAILADALESVINVAAGVFAVLSLYIALLPADANHPYGHGKIEHVSAGFEGALILTGGLFIIGNTIYNWNNIIKIDNLQFGFWLTLFSGLLNGFFGFLLIRSSNKSSSALMNAEGNHLLSDAASSAALCAGLLIIKYTGLFWLDKVLAIVFACLIVFIGLKIVIKSIAVLIDQADYQTLNQIISILNEHRQPEWIDIHNLRVQKFGNTLHIDAHLTLPYYLTLEQVHQHINQVESLLGLYLKQEVELFIHADPCLPTLSCQICNLNLCPVRAKNQISNVEWTLKTLLPNLKHHLLVENN